MVKNNVDIALSVTSGVVSMVGLTLEELNLILSIILTVVAVISLIVSLTLSIIKLVSVIMQKIKLAKEDGKITQEEFFDIVKTGEDGLTVIADETNTKIEDIKKGVK